MIQDPARDILTPTQLNTLARDLLESAFPLVWVEAELGNVTRPASGHLYFTLKDARAQVKCAMFKPKSQWLKFAPREGLRVLARGRLTLYEARGDYQLVLDHLEEAGEGALRRAFEELKARLAAEGLFASERKRALPAFVRRLAVITSPSGAAVRDVLNILRRRWPIVPVLIYPVPVQGAGAADLIAKAIRYASHCQDCDVLIVARGGGSLEDLWAFNEEVVALAIADCLIPVISGVGHEVDFTIADFVADLRAPTPSGAAELAVPDWQSWHRELIAQEKRLARGITRVLSRHAQTYTWLRHRLSQRHPGLELRQKSQRCDELEARLLRALTHRLHRAQSLLASHAARLRHVSPTSRLAEGRGRLHNAQARLLPTLQLRLLAERSRLRQAETRLAPAMQTRLRAQRSRLEASDSRLEPTLPLRLDQLTRQLNGLGRTLHAVSPLATLERGYAIVTDEAAHVMTDASQLQPGQQVHTRLATGTFISRVVRGPG